MWCVVSKLPSLMFWYLDFLFRWQHFLFYIDSLFFFSISHNFDFLPLLHFLSNPLFCKTHTSSSTRLYYLFHFCSYFYSLVCSTFFHSFFFSFFLSFTFITFTFLYFFLYEFDWHRLSTLNCLSWYHRLFIILDTQNEDYAPRIDPAGCQ